MVRVLSARRGVTLMELLLVILFVGLGYVGVAHLMSHSLRTSERAQRRSELTAAAFAELERLRVETTTHPDLRPHWVHTPPGGRMRLTVGSSPAAEGALVAIEVRARSLDMTSPLEISLTGWVPPSPRPRRAGALR